MLSSSEAARAAAGSTARSAPNRQTDAFLSFIPSRFPPANPASTKKRAGPRGPALEHSKCRLVSALESRSIQRESDDAIATLVVELHVAARSDHNVLLAADCIRRRRRIDAGPGLERPEHVAVLGIIGAEPAIAFTGEDEPASGRENAADHRLRRLLLPLDLAGVVVDGGYVSGLFFGGDHLERAAEPEL